MTKRFKLLNQMSFGLPKAGQRRSMKVTVTLRVDEKTLAALRRYAGLTTEEDIKVLVEGIWGTFIEDVLSEYEEEVGK